MTGFHDSIRIAEIIGPYNKSVSQLLRDSFRFVHLVSESHETLKKCLGHVSAPKQKKVKLIESKMKIKPNLGQLDGLWFLFPFSKCVVLFLV